MESLYMKYQDSSIFTVSYLIIGADLVSLVLGKIMNDRIGLKKAIIFSFLISCIGSGIMLLGHFFLISMNLKSAAK